MTAIPKTTSTDCAICLGEIDQGTTIDCPNRHSYHDSCFQAWRTAWGSSHPGGGNVTCPICRTPIIGTALPANNPAVAARGLDIEGIFAEALLASRSMIDGADHDRVLRNISEILSRTPLYGDNTLANAMRLLNQVPSVEDQEEEEDLARESPSPTSW